MWKRVFCGISLVFGALLLCIAEAEGELFAWPNSSLWFRTTGAGSLLLVTGLIDLWLLLRNGRKKQEPPRVGSGDGTP